MFCLYFVFFIVFTLLLSVCLPSSLINKECHPAPPNTIVRVMALQIPPLRHSLLLFFLLLLFPSNPCSPCSHLLPLFFTFFYVSSSSTLFSMPFSFLLFLLLLLFPSIPSSPCSSLLLLPFFSTSFYASSPSILFSLLLLISFSSISNIEFSYIYWSF